MEKIKFYITFLDGTIDECIGTGVWVNEGMLIVDCGPLDGQCGYNIRAIKSWYSEPADVY